MSYHVDTRVPLPIAKGRSRVHEFPIPTMSVGDSFVCITREERNAAMRAAKHWMRVNRGQHFTSRKTQEGFRIWRDA